MGVSVLEVFLLGFFLDSGHKGGVMFVFVNIQVYAGGSHASFCMQDSCIN